MTDINTWYKGYKPKQGEIGVVELSERCMRVNFGDDRKLKKYKCFKFPVLGYQLKELRHEDDLGGCV